MRLQWFRLYHRVIDDEKIRLLAFEDRWHFIAVCCLKADGLLDDPESDLKWRKIAVKLGVQLRELDEIKRRLCEVGLVDSDMQPTAWDELQYRSDNSTERVKRYREKNKKNKGATQRNVSVTGQDTETDTETDISSLRSDGGRELFDEIWEAFPRSPYSKQSEALHAFNDLSASDQLLAIEGAEHFAAWFREEAGRRKEPIEDRLAYAPVLAKWLRNRGWVDALALKVKAKPSSEAAAALAAVEYVDRVKQPALFAACEQIRGKTTPPSIQRFAFDKAIVTQARSHERQIA